MGRLTRRAFLKRTSLCTLSAGAYLTNIGNLAPGQEEKVDRIVRREKAPFKILYNNDSTNTAGCVSPWHKKGEPFREELLAASIDEVAGTGVDVHLLSPGVGWIPWWPSEVYPDHYQWWMKKTGLESDGYGYSDYFLNGGDMVKVLVDRCKANGMAPFVSYRLNDCHLMEFMGTKHPKSAWVSRFYAEHPEYMLDPKHKEKAPEGYSHLRGQNWAIPEVRDYKFALIEEVCANYDLAGLELDFLRDNMLFRLDETDEQQRVDIISAFVKKVRRMLDRTARPGQRRYFCVRIPLQIAAHGAIGLDVLKLAEAGVDMLNLSDWYGTNQRTDIAEVRRIVPDAAIYFEMTQSSGRSGHGPGDYPYPRTSDEQFYTAAHLAHSRGADGISLFNFAFYREHGRPPKGFVNEPPFHVLPHLSDPAWLAQQPQYYWASFSMYYNQMYRHVRPGKSETFLFDMVPPEEAKSGDGRLRIHTEKPFGAAELAVRMNGVSLVATDDVSSHYANPYDALISDLPQRRAWICPVGILRDGLNELEVRLVTADAVKVTVIDLAVA